MQKIQHLCDICHLEDDVEKSANHLAVQFSVENNVMVADMCERHLTFLNETMDLYFRAGRRPDTIVTPKAVAKPKSKGGPKPTPVGDFPCKVNGCPRSFTSEQGVSMHLTRVHQIPGVQSAGQEAHDAAIAAASADDKALATSGNTHITLVKATTRAGKTEEQREAERERDRARKARKREALRQIGS